MDQGIARRRAGRAARADVHAARRADGRAEGRVRALRRGPQPRPRPSRELVVGREVQEVRWWESLRLKRRKGVDMASLKEVEKVADDLEQLVGELRSELSNGTRFREADPDRRRDQREGGQRGPDLQHRQRDADVPHRRPHGKRARQPLALVLRNRRRARPDGCHRGEGRGTRDRGGGRGGRRRGLRAAQGADQQGGGNVAGARSQRRGRATTTTTTARSAQRRRLARGGSLLSTVWDSAAGSLLPLAEEAADAAGSGRRRTRPTSCATRSCRASSSRSRTRRRGLAFG